MLHLLPLHMTLYAVAPRREAARPHVAEANVDARLAELVGLLAAIRAAMPKPAAEMRPTRAPRQAAVRSAS
eukprot:4680470-Pleurochrysis_carterae.AAC.1